VVAEHRERVAVLPGGETGTLEDVAVLVRRRA